MLPVIAIVGHTNVGKSTLFNRLTHTRAALVRDIAGLTRDRQYGEANFENRNYIVVDTGGLDIEANLLKKLEKTNSSTDLSLEELMAKQSLQAITEADAVLFLVDAREGIAMFDQHIASLLRKRKKSVYLLVNKVDGLDSDTAIADFYEFGLGKPFPISAEHGLGIQDLLLEVFAQIPEMKSEVESEAEEQRGIKVAFIGKPNVGKSTLLNRILGEERMVVYDKPGTTRDSIFVKFSRHNKNYTLIDTAGVRRKSKVTEVLEKFSVIKTLQAIEAANVVVLMIDARTNLTDQDLWLLGFIIEAGKALVIAVNKWDNLSREDRASVRKELDRRLAFVDFAKIHFISALHGTGVGNLFTSINEAFHSATSKLETAELTRILERIVAAHEPPLVRGRRIKLRYAHQGGTNPPCIVIHGKQTDAISEDYRRYLAGAFRKALRLVGTPLQIIFKSSKNPYIQGL